MGSYRPLHTYEQHSDTLHLPLPTRLESLKQKEKKTKDKMPMSHFTFLEKISEGLFVEGVNHRRGGEKPIDIAASSPQQLEDLIQSSNRRCQRPRVGRPRLHDEHHPACYSIFHRLARAQDDMTVATPPSNKKSSKKPAKTRGTKRRLVDSDCEPETDDEDNFRGVCVRSRFGSTKAYLERVERRMGTSYGYGG
mmetsp:Transcript_9981/g.29042  ORF Transcript_9981/g.29042 Transcript_9981/m.29042 type:complete len:194 (+) Transcript_9981:116-697(+)